MENNISQILNIYREPETKEIKSNNLILLLVNSKYEIFAKIDNKYMLLREFLEFSNDFIFDNDNYYSHEEGYFYFYQNQKEQDNINKNIKENPFIYLCEKIKSYQPIINFDFYCHCHDEKNKYFCLDCKKHLCNKCMLLSSTPEKSLLKGLQNIIAFSKESNIKIRYNNENILNLKKIPKFIEFDKFKKINCTTYSYSDLYKYIHTDHNIINLNENKLNDSEINYYENIIDIIQKKLEKSKISENNKLLLSYCRMYLDYYKRNIQLGLNYDVISTIKNSIIFNEKFLSQNNSNSIENENESEELILNIPIESLPYKFLNILSISEIDIIIIMKLIMIMMKKKIVILI